MFQVDAVPTPISVGDREKYRQVVLFNLGRNPVVYGPRETYADGDCSDLRLGILRPQQQVSLELVPNIELWAQAEDGAIDLEVLFR
jgi:hypothetical protein